MRKHLCEKQSEFNFCETVTDIFHGASLEAEPLGPHPHIVTQLFVALFDVVSIFAAFKLCDRHPLPFHQLFYLAAQNIRLSHAVSPLKSLTLADSQPSRAPRRPSLRKFLTFLIALASIVFAACSPAFADSCSRAFGYQGGTSCNSSIASWATVICAI
jgi:hypothetical protein